MPSTSWDEAIEQIDIGGPTMIRSAAKNQDFVGVVTSPEQYELVATEIEAGGLELETRRSLARERLLSHRLLRRRHRQLARRRRRPGPTGNDSGP